MASLCELWRRLKFLLRRQQFERDLESEMKFHKQLRQEEYRNMGIGQDSAWYKTQRRFGNDTLFKEFSREVCLLTPKPALTANRGRCKSQGASPKSRCRQSFGEGSNGTLLLFPSVTGT